MFIVLAFFFYVGRSFFKLAVRYGRNEGLFILAGLITFIGMTIVGTTLVTLIDMLFGFTPEKNSPAMASRGMLGALIGLFSITELHYLLRRKWEKA